MHELSWEFHIGRKLLDSKAFSSKGVYTYKKVINGYGGDRDSEVAHYQINVQAERQLAGYGKVLSKEQGDCEVAEVAEPCTKWSHDIPNVEIILKLWFGEY